MAEIHRLEHPTDKTTGGVLLVFREDLKKQAAWHKLEPGTDVQALAKDIAARVLASLLESGEGAAASEVNWVSVVAAVAKHVRDAQSRLMVH